MDKISQRQFFKTLRQQLSADYRRQAMVKIEKFAMQYFNSVPATNVSSFINIGSEIDLKPLNNWFEEQTSHTLLLPSTEGDQMFMEDANRNQHMPDYCIMPCLAYDKLGHRLGYGAGYYDRYFANHKVNNRIIINFAKLEADKIAYDNWDTPATVIINENGIYTI